ncbi:fatty acid desaturase [Nodosilinea sp. E11]|uniref:fatty acid desaturase n=1 Tax=Nodosilinea sp. E11 TaxID=3037479 RepID=UPI00293491B8|nr:fatty acid desaturase [Nodosilinea sp. E11]WOD40095.1 fatty acid desaturase [Nodosilinea sp. E11]
MKTQIKKSDFILKPYMESNDWLATWQILNTLVPYLVLWVLAIKAASISLWLLPPIVGLIVLFALRSFSLMHDCGHYSLFRSKRANRIVGFMLGLINAIPQYGWSRDHAYHHKTNGDWERYRGVADFLSTDEFSKLSPSDQKLYERLRQPLMAIPGGFFYLAIKPRLTLVAGIYEFVSYAWTTWRQNPDLSWSDIVAKHRSRHWLSAAEFWDLLLNNVCVIGGCLMLGYWLGFGLFLGLYSIVLTLSATIFIWIFFVQHIFEDAYAHKTETWDYVLGAVEGSTYLQLPPVLNWFTADIGYHNIHHLSERIPNYYIKACYHKNSHLLTQVKTLRLVDMPNCARFILWDAAASRLVSVDSFRAAALAEPVGAKSVTV